MEKSTIGEVIVTEQCENPYTYKGILRIGTMRKHALAAFHDGEDTTGMILWHAPASGGARRIHRDDIDWRGLRVEWAKDDPNRPPDPTLDQIGLLARDARSALTDAVNVGDDELEPYRNDEEFDGCMGPVADDVYARLAAARVERIIELADAA